MGKARLKNVPLPPANRGLLATVHGGVTTAVALNYAAYARLVARDRLVCGTAP